jgi:hypothetical protein
MRNFDHEKFINIWRKKLADMANGIFEEEEIRVYFDPETYRDLYMKGLSCSGSTERICNNDVFLNVPTERISSITHGGVIVNIKGETI